MRTASETTDLQQATRWYVFVRLLFLFTFSVPGILGQYLTEGLSDQVRRDSLLVLIAFGTNGIFYILATLRTNDAYLKNLVRIWIALDILLVTFLIFIKGGIESRSPILYAMPILISAAIFGRKSSYVAAFASAVTYTSILIADYFGIIHTVGALNPALRYNLPYVIQSLCFFPAILFVIALAADFITKLLKEQQQRANEHLANLITAQEIAKLGSWEWDIAHDHITWSKELYKLFGIQPHSIELKYDTYLTLIHPDDMKQLHKKIINTVQKKSSFTADHRIIMPDGSIKYIHSSGRPLLDEAGHVIKLAGTAQDVTELHHLDIAKRDFIALASHQLRTPASGVKAFLSILLDGYAGELSKKQREFISKAHDSNNRQLEIIDGLLNLASIQSGKIFLQKEKVDLRTVLTKSLSPYRQTIKTKKQRLIINKFHAPIYVNVDPNHLQMVIDNLISNASKYTPAGGKITVTPRTTTASAYIEIEDTGIGIAKEDLPLLFQKFSRLNNPASGTIEGSGLGLFLAKSIIELHSGTITVRSFLGKGTLFRIKLPLVKPKK